jgi:hypothetical protein
MSSPYGDLNIPPSPSPIENPQPAAGEFIPENKSPEQLSQQIGVISAQIVAARTYAVENGAAINPSYSRGVSPREVVVDFIGSLSPWSNN